MFKCSRVERLNTLNTQLKRNGFIMNYQLEKYHGVSSRHQCPKCGDKHSFAYYVGDDGSILNKAVGRCNHESSCGYHYTPKQYFIDNPDVQMFKCSRREHLNKHEHSLPKKPLCTIPFEYVERSASYNSQFIYFLCGLFDKGKLESPTIERLMNDYALGATKDGCIIFWQIDINGKVRDGKIMRYNGETGKRIDVFPNTPVYWVSKEMKKKEMLLQDWEKTQCLFGEHLLHFPSNKNKVVALVESEKNALIGAAVYPEYVWVSCSNCKGFKEDMLQVLKGRTVIAFPDTGMYEEWKGKARQFSFAKIIVSDILEGKGLPINYDIADWIIEDLSKENVDIQKVKAEVSETERILLAMQEKNPALTLLIEKFGLELVG